ncbi:helix-turn-helix domain-containing protein [Pseudomonas sp. HMWF032]|nr:helix-turn-helix domain-containing protein [Pseudomonas sp. HMWF032]PTT84593.1 helix-turn-helix domain-containing protein [Pseudomonas sp. HMWF010]
MLLNVDGAAQNSTLEAEPHWFHMFVTMIRGGDVAKLGPHATTVYLVIKAYANYTTGDSYPGLELIAEKSGVSIAQVKRELKTLESHGYVCKERRGRSNHYQLREKIEIRDDVGRPTAVASWDYLPCAIRHAVEELKNVLVTGDPASARIIQIERLQVNVNHLHDNATNFNVQQYLAALDGLPANLRSNLKRNR